MSEDTENLNAGATENAVDEDDWAAAMAEQAIAESTAAAPAAVPAAAQIFQNFGGDPAKGSVMNELDMILDIPVQITVCLLYTAPSPRDRTRSRMPSSA